MQSFGVLRETQCPRCGRDVDLPFGALCRECSRAIARRARRVARRSALAAVALFAIWVLLRLPPDPTARLVAGIAAMMVWVTVYTIVHRTVRHWLS